MDKLSSLKLQRVELTQRILSGIPWYTSMMRKLDLDKTSQPRPSLTERCTACSTVISRFAAAALKSAVVELILSYVAQLRCVQMDLDFPSTGL